MDLLLIGASAVFQRNFFALENPFIIVELAFHSGEKWKHLAAFSAWMTSKRFGNTCVSYQNHSATCSVVRRNPPDWRAPPY